MRKTAAIISNLESAFVLTVFLSNLAERFVNGKPSTSSGALSKTNVMFSSVVFNRNFSALVVYDNGNLDMNQFTVNTKQMVVNCMFPISF